MICKTEAIVLRTYKYQDTNLIATLYTREYGLMRYMLKGYRSPKNRKKYSYFQPLSLIDIVFVNKPNRDLQQIKESKSNKILFQIQQDPIKLSLGLSIIEIFFQCVKEEERNTALYDFLRSCIVEIDHASEKLIQVFVYFLVHFTGYLGFFPNDQSEGASRVAFHVQEGALVQAEKQDRIAFIIRRFMETDTQSCKAISFDQETKRSLINTLFTYYHMHVEGFAYPNTLRVFSEVFG